MGQRVRFSLLFPSPRFREKEEDVVDIVRLVRLRKAIVEALARMNQERMEDDELSPIPPMTSELSIVEDDSNPELSDAAYVAETGGGSIESLCAYRLAELRSDPSRMSQKIEPRYEWTYPQKGIVFITTRVLVDGKPDGVIEAIREKARVENERRRTDVRRQDLTALPDKR